MPLWFSLLGWPGVDPIEWTGEEVEQAPCQEVKGLILIGKTK